MRSDVWTNERKPRRKEETENKTYKSQQKNKLNLECVKNQRYFDMKAYCKSL